MCRLSFLFVSQHNNRSSLVEYDDIDSRGTFAATEPISYRKCASSDVDSLKGEACSRLPLCKDPVKSAPPSLETAFATEGQKSGLTFALRGPQYTQVR